jgi:hypothetical protein
VVGDDVPRWGDLTPAQRHALGVLFDKAGEVQCWKRRTDENGGAGRGRVNTTASGALCRLQLARTIDYGSVFVAGSVTITALGKQVYRDGAL